MLLLSLKFVCILSRFNLCLFCPSNLYVFWAVLSPTNHRTGQENPVPKINFIILESSNTLARMYILFTEIRKLIKFAKNSSHNSDWIQLIQNTFNSHIFVKNINETSNAIKKGRYFSTSDIVFSSKTMLSEFNILCKSILTFQSVMVTWYTKSLAFKNFTFCHTVFMFSIYLRTNLPHTT